MEPESCSHSEGLNETGGSCLNSVRTTFGLHLVHSGGHRHGRGTGVQSQAAHVGVGCLSRRCWLQQQF